MPFVRIPIADRFWPKVNKTDGCWEWTGALMGKGYGAINEGGRRGRMLHAHRVAWVLTRGPIPPGLFVCHHCDNMRCVRPDHLFVGTNSENMLDCSRKGRLGVRRSGCGRGVTRNAGESNIHALLTLADVATIRASNDTDKILGARFGVSWHTVRAVRRRRTWRAAP
jgi:hypothetical protein